MPNGDSKRSAYLKAKNLHDCWIIALYISSFIADGRINLEWFNNPLKVNFNDGLASFTMNPPKDINSIIGTTDNLRRTALGTCFVAFDEALLDLFGDRPTEPNDDINSLRIIIYMMRCSFAHNPAEPKWEIHKTFQKSVKVRAINFEIDFSKLDGVPVKFEHHGGSKGLVDLMSYVLDVIKTKEHPKETFH